MGGRRHSIKRKYECELEDCALRMKGKEDWSIETPQTDNVPSILQSDKEYKRGEKHFQREINHWEFIHILILIILNLNLFIFNFYFFIIYFFQLNQLIKYLTY